MTNNENKQYYIYLRSTKERIPCTKEEFDNYYHEIDLFRQRQVYRKMCVCPQRKHLECDMDCLTCPFHRNSCSSLDFTFTDVDGEEHSFYETLEDPSPLFSDILADTERLKELFLKLETLMPEAIEIGKLREYGLSDEAIAERIGIGRKTYAYRLKKVKKVLEEEFSEFF